jgi:hypothetical protein
VTWLKAIAGAAKYVNGATYVIPAGQMALAEGQSAPAAKKGNGGNG